jgi:hypothetical protein
MPGHSENEKDKLFRGGFLGVSSGAFAAAGVFPRKRTKPAAPPAIDPSQHL